MSQIHWLSQADGLFTTAADWSGGTVPGAGDGALLDAAGALNYTVTSTGNVTVGSLSTGATATLAITAKVFDVLAGTGAGTNAGTILIGDGARLEVTGTVANTGLISVAGATKSTSFLIGAGGASLTGAGRLVLGGPASDVFAVSAATVLTNVDNTVSGAGQLGNGKLTFVNAAAGVVDADASGALVVNTIGSVLTNDGLMESVGSGGLTIRSTTVDDSGGGTIAAAGGQVRLQTARLIGGTLTSSGAGAIHAASGLDVLDGGAGALTNLGRVIVDNGHGLTIEGAIANSGTIVVNAGTTGTALTVAAGGATLTGGGKINLANSAFSHLTGASSAATLTNVDNTIAGGGQIGLGSLTLVNEAKGVINASAPTALVLNTKGEDVINAGLIEGTGTGGLSILNTTLDDRTGGTVFAGAGSKVTLTQSTLQGGVLTTKGTGVITTAGRLSALDGLTSTLSNQGAVVVADNTSLTLRGAIANTGKISLASTGDVTQLLVDAAGATLTGAGAVALGSNAANQIRAASAATLINVDNTISGAGAVGNGALTIDNRAAGVINANQAAAMVLSTPGQAVANDGLIEGTGVGGLTISATTISGAGVIKAGNGSSVSLVGARISGGTLSTAGTGVILASGYASVIDGTSTHPVTVIGALKVGAATALRVQGAIALSQTVGTTTTKGAITLAGAVAQAHLVVGGPGATFTGAGSVILGDSTSNLIAGTLTGSTVSRLTNSATITGAGWIGSSLSLINTGVIAATGANALTLQTGSYKVAGSNRITNSGLLEALNPNNLGATGGLQINGVSLSGGGTIEASGAATHVDLYNATISGQTLITAGGGSINALGYGDLIDGKSAAVTNMGTLTVAGGRLGVQGTIGGTGVIAIGTSGGGFASLAVNAAGATLTGGGSLVLSDGTLNFVYAFSGVGTLTNAGDTISGAGQFSNNLGLVNQAAGVIKATGTHSLALEDGAITNAGLMEDTGAGGLEIDGAVTNSGTILSAGAGGVTIYGAVANTGLLEAQTGTLALHTYTVTNSAAAAVKVDAGGQFALDGATITGGVVSIVAGGALGVSKFSALTPTSLSNQGVIDVVGGARLTLKGSVNNAGVIDVGVGGGASRLALQAPGVTLGGGGGVVLTDSAQNYIYNYSGGHATLTNLDNTISGAGQLSGYFLTLINKAAGVIDANGANFLYIGTGGNTITNAGLIESTGAGGLGIYSAISNSGTILAAGAGTLTVHKSVTNSGLLEASGGTLALDADTVTNMAIGSVGAVTGTVELENAVLKGGGLFTGVGGTIAIASYAAVATASVTNQGTIAVATGARLELAGSVNNSGLIAIGAPGGYGSLGLLSGVTLSGGGTLALADSAQTQLYGPGAGVALTNVGDTISGAGTIAQSVTLINKTAGVVDANGKNTLDIGGLGVTTTNAGLIEATGAGGLYIVGGIANSGTLSANGGVVTLYNGTVTNTGLVSVAAASTLELYVEDVVGGAVSVAAGGTIKVDVGSTDALATKSLINQGTIALATGAELHVQGAVNNSGVIDVGPVGGWARLGVLAGGATLSGGGTVVLGDNVNSYIYAKTPGARLTNVSDTITGAGHIQGGLGLTNQAAGVIDATGANPLFLGTAYDIVNAGLIENTGTGGLTIYSTVVTNTGAIAAKSGTLTVSGALVTQTGTGAVSAAAGAELLLDTSTVLGGAVSVAAGGEIAADGHVIIRAKSFTNAGTVAVANNGSLELSGSVSNSGEIDIGPSGGYGRLGVDANGVVLSGGGTVVLADSDLSRIYASGASGTLTNIDNIISGAGYIGNGDALTLVNRAAGTIEASGSHVLTLATGGNLITNAGLIEDLGMGELMIRSGLSNSGTVLSNGTGGVVFYGAVANSHTLEAEAGFLDFVGLTVTNTGAGLLKADAGASVDLVNFAEVLGGTVDTEAGGKLNIYGSDTVEAAAFTNKGTVQVGAYSTLAAQGKVNNTGAIDIGAAGSPGHVGILGAGLTLTGAGQVVLSDNKYNSIFGVTAATLTNVNNTISGAGFIGGANLTMDNQAGGVIDANGSQLLQLEGGFNTLTNEGLLETTGAGSLSIYARLINSGRVRANGSGELTVANVGGNSGTLEAAKGVLDLVNNINNTATGVVKADAGATIVAAQLLVTGGTISIAAGGFLDNTSSNTLRLTADTFTNKGTIDVAAGKFVVSGLVTNSGLIELGDGGGLGVLSAGVTLSGGGTVDIGDSASSLVYAYNGLTTLTNVNNTIKGGGTIGGALYVVNEAAGVIDGDGTQALVFGPNAPSITNAGLIESTASGGVTFSLDSIVGGGTIAANGAASHVDLTNTTISGQTLITSAGGAINALGTGDLLDGTAASVTVDGAVSLGSGVTLTVQGVIAGTGDIAIQSGAGAAGLLVTTQGVTLTGGGTVALSDSSQNFIYSSGGPATLTNTGDTISGAGNLGDANLTLNNQASGVIDATGVNALILNTGPNAITNAGLIEATGAGGLAIDSSVYNSGTLEGAGGLLTLSGVTTVFNTATGVVTAANGYGVLLSGAYVFGGTVSTAVGGVIAVGAGFSKIEPATLTNQGTIKIADGGYLRLNGLVTNSGVIDVGPAGGLAHLDIIDTAGLTLTGGGTVALGGAGRINAKTGLVNFDNTISGVGVLYDASKAGFGITNQAAGVINANGASGLYVISTYKTITNAGLMEATGPGGLVIENNVTNSGTLKGNGGELHLSHVTVTNTGGVVSAAAASQVDLFASAILGGAFSNAVGGSIAVSGVSVIEAATMTNAGTIQVANSSTLKLQGKVDNSGAIYVGATGGYGRIEIDTAGLTLTGGGSVTLADSASGYIHTAVGGRLVNVDNTISGASRIQSAGLTITNAAAGVIDANGAYSLTLSTGTNTITNAGLMEATGAGGLFVDGVVSNSGTLAGAGGVLHLNGTTIDNTAAGVVTAASGYGVELSAALIIGGTVSTAVGGTLGVGGVSGIEPATLTNQGTIQIANYGALYLDRVVNNSGVIAVGPSGDYATLDIDTDGVTLTGGGQVVLSDNIFSRILAPAGGALVNTDNTISGGGVVGGNGATITNQAAGVIDATGVQVLFLASSGQTIVNAGLLEASNAGGAGLTVNAALDNSGTIAANGGNVLVIGDVSGAGVAVIAAGTLRTESTFSQNVSFTGTGGELDLDHALLFGGTISGFSHIGGTSLDLGDVGFVSSDEATFSGTTAGGVLTVTDGTNTASIHLTGDYTGSTFVASSDGNGGTTVVDPTVSHLTSAMAAFTTAGSSQATATAPPATRLLPTLASSG